MENDFWVSFWEKLKELYEEEDGNPNAFNQEFPVLDKVLKKINEEFASNNTYEFVKPVGRGGAGIVIQLKDIRLNLDRALKLPRPREEKLLDSVRSEMEYLNRIRHENIINLYLIGEVDIPEYQMPYPYFVMSFIEDAQDLRKKVQTLVNEATETKELRDITKWIANKFFEIAKAVEFLHKQRVIHFDIKPSNILITKEDKPILSDLGFAKKKTDEVNPVVIGFTLFYAHPTLRSEYTSMSSKNRVRKELPPKDFEYIFDIYAFGKSVLEILSLIDRQFADAVHYDYTFIYLHLLACRMLDSKNLSKSDTDSIRDKQLQEGIELSVYKETWLELDANCFKDLKYESIEEVRKDIEKLIFDNTFLESVPELNAFYPKRVQSSHGVPAPFSKRVKLIVEHPVFSRLANIMQLGLTNDIYPTATHNRLEHSLGVFRNCCLYLQSLYNDPYNPVFRQFVNESDIKCILLASLLHDLGHYPLAHAIEETVKELKHEKFTRQFLQSKIKDKNGHTLKDIIEDKLWGWGVNIDYLSEMLVGDSSQEPLLHRKSLKTNMLTSIIDGPIDIDKLDYLIRDSQNSYLKYGELIDTDRLIRHLTVILMKDTSGHIRFIVGAYEKGQSAAESLAFARYLLYQSLYWHHTARSIRAMLREAIKPALNKSEGKKKIKTFIQDFRSAVLTEGNLYQLSNNNVLGLISKWTDEDGKNFIELINQRNYYKRILTIHSYQESPKGKESLINKFRRVHKDLGFQDKLQKRIRDSYESYLSATSSQKISLLAPQLTNKVLEILDTPKKIILDCPSPTYGTSDYLRFIPEPHRLHKNYFKRAETGERVSEVWNRVYFELMDIAAKGRIYCHPDIRDSLMAALGPDGIKEQLVATINEYE